MSRVNVACLPAQRTRDALTDAITAGDGAPAPTGPLSSWPQWVRPAAKVSRQTAVCATAQRATDRGSVLEFVQPVAQAVECRESIDHCRTHSGGWGRVSHPATAALLVTAARVQDRGRAGERAPGKDAAGLGWGNRARCRIRAAGGGTVETPLTHLAQSPALTPLDTIADSATAGLALAGHRADSRFHVGRR